MNANVLKTWDAKMLLRSGLTIPAVDASARLRKSVLLVNTSAGRPAIATANKNAAQKVINKT